MDKILAFSILSSSPADISATGFSTRLSWRTSASAGSHKEQHHQQQVEKAPRQQQEKATEQQSGSRPAERKQARFAPEFDGINCFESIVS
ncbi:unnamed protein product [Urochloa humidicola]